MHLEVKKAEILPHVGKDLQGTIAVHLKGGNLNSYYPLWQVVGRLCGEGYLCIF